MLLLLVFFVALNGLNHETLVTFLNLNCILVAVDVLNLKKLLTFLF